MNNSEREWANQLYHDTHTKIYGSPGVTGNIASQGIWHLHTNRIIPLELHTNTNYAQTYACWRSSKDSISNMY